MKVYSFWKYTVLTESIRSWPERIQSRRKIYGPRCKLYCLWQNVYGHFRKVYGPSRNVYGPLWEVYVGWKPFLTKTIFFKLKFENDYHRYKTCAICIYFDSKYNFWFDGKKFFWFRPRKIWKSAISQNAWAKSKLWMKIRNFHKILRRMVYSYSRYYMLVSKTQSNSRLRRRGTLISLKSFTHA